MVGPAGGPSTLGSGCVFAGGWLKMRYVSLVPRGGGAGGLPSSIAIVLGRDSSVMRLPDYHATVPAHASTSHPHPLQPQSAAHLPVANSGPAAQPPPPPLLQPQAPTYGISLLPQGQGTERIRLGAHGAICTRPDSDLTPESLLRHQAPLPPPPQPVGGAPFGGMPPPLWKPGLLRGAPVEYGHQLPSHVPLRRPQEQPLTSVVVPRMAGTLPLLSVREALDRHEDTPCLLRVCARVRQALPLDPLLWTAQSRAGALEYQMVLQLTDAVDDKVFLGAILIGDEASSFFFGLPPVDLMQSNASLMSLRKRVALLMDAEAPPTEFCLWACRPGADATERGVAYHIVSTQCLAV